MRNIDRLLGLLADGGTTLPELARRMLAVLANQLRDVAAQVMAVEAELLAWHRANDVSRRLATIPGVGPITASAIVATVGDAAQFKSGRQFAAWLGLVPRQISTGDRTIHGKISKRGNRYLRVLFVQAAWVVLVKRNSRERLGLDRWLESARKRLHHNVLAIALANKLARIAWSVLVHGRTFEAGNIAEAIAQTA